VANLEELKKSVRQIFRLRPRPFLVEGYREDAISALTTSGPKRERIGNYADYDWELTDVDLTARTVTLVCVFTRHEVILNSDDIKEHRKPHEATASGTDGRPALMLKSKLYMEPNGRVLIDPS